MNFTELKFQKEYRSPQHDVANEFFAPVLACSKIYKRSVGFFSSTSLEIITKGISSLVKNGGKIQIVASPKLSEEDIEAIKTGYDKKSEIIEKRLLGELESKEENYFTNQRLNLLANLIAKDILSIKIAFKDNGSLVGIYHEKLGVFEDFEGNKIAFDGSMNESKTAMCYNYESINVYCGWLSEDKSRVELKIKAFDNIWNNTEENLNVVEFPSVTKRILDKYKTKDFNTEEIAEKLESLDKTEDRKKVEYKIDHTNLEGNEELKIAQIRSNIPTIPSDIHLYDYQKEAIKNWKENNFCGIFDMATGTGKTLTSLGAIVELYQTSQNFCTIILCPYIHLVTQWVEDIERFNIKPIIAFGSSFQKNWKDKLERAIEKTNLDLLENKYFCLITTIATFKNEFVQKQISKIKTDILLIADEAHNLGSQGTKFFLKPEKYKYRLALSATLERHFDKSGTQVLYNFFGQKCIEYNLKRAIFENHLVPYKYYPIIVNLDIKERNQYFDLTKSISKEIVFDKKTGKKKLNEKGKLLCILRSKIIASCNQKIPALLNALKPYKDDNNILIYCGAVNFDEDFYSDEDDENSSKQIDEIIKQVYSNFKMKICRFTAETKIEERETIKQKFAEGKDLQAIAAIKCLDEGVNIPSIKTAFILASSTNPKEYIQRRGRVLRKSKGKTFAEIYDFITLPFELEEIKYKTDFEKKTFCTLAKNEVERLKEFSALAINSYDSIPLINKITKTFNLEDKNIFLEDINEQ